MDRWTDCASHKPWPRMDRLLDTTRGKGKKLTNGQTMLHTNRGPEWTDCASHKLCCKGNKWTDGPTVLHTSRGRGKNGQMDRLCFTQAVAQNGQTMLHTSRDPE